MRVEDQRGEGSFMISNWYINIGYLAICCGLLPSVFLEKDDQTLRHDGSILVYPSALPINA